MGKAKSRDDKLLTEVELELMTIIWQLGDGAVADVIDRLPAGRDLAYTSVSTVLRILEQKGVLKTRKEGRGHIYIPVLKKSDYEARALKHVVEHVFENTPVALVRQLIGQGELKLGDLAEIKSMIEKLERQK